MCRGVGALLAGWAAIYTQCSRDRRCQCHQWGWDDAAGPAHDARDTTAVLSAGAGLSAGRRRRRRQARPDARPRRPCTGWPPSPPPPPPLAGATAPRRVAEECFRRGSPGAPSRRGWTAAVRGCRGERVGPGAPRRLFFFFVVLGVSVDSGDPTAARGSTARPHRRALAHRRPGGGAAAAACIAVCPRPAQLASSPPPRGLGGRRGVEQPLRVADCGHARRRRRQPRRGADCEDGLAVTGVFPGDVWTRPSRGLPCRRPGPSQSRRPSPSTGGCARHCPSQAPPALVHP